ncbi:MAG: cupin domain-containing protein [Acidobacteriota bacterium]|nr:cupin domain-containing protein [Acidobacteriota bacterium]
MNTTPAPNRLIENLATLIEPLTLDRFIGEYWGRRPLYLPGNGEQRFNSLLDRTRFESLLRREDVIVKATFNDYGNMGAVQGGINNEIPIKHDQIDCLRAMTSVTLTLSSLQNVDPILAKLTAGVKKQLAFSGLVESSAWLSKPGTGLPVHFDECAVFMMQIEGKKTWRVSKRPAVNWPTLQCLLGPDREPLYHGFLQGDFELNAEDWLMNVGETDESQFITFTMEPGDLCFLPAGTWHTTKAADEESLAVNIRLPHLTLWELFSRALKKDLLNREEWRHMPVFPYLNTKHGFDEVLNTFRRQFAGFQEYVAGLDPNQLDFTSVWMDMASEMDALQNPPTTIEPDTRLQLAKSRPIYHMTKHHLEGEEITVLANGKTIDFFEPEFIPFAKTLLAGQPFSAHQAGAWFSEPKDWEETQGILETLWDAGVIESAD